MKIIEVNALPAHGDLDHAMKLAERGCRGHQNAAPHHGADPGQPDFDLQDRVGARRRVVFRNEGFRPSFHQPRLSHLTHPSPDTPGILMLSSLDPPMRRIAASKEANRTFGVLRIGGESRVQWRLVLHEAVHHPPYVDLTP